MRVLITPSILAADFGHLQDEIESIESCADALQADVMDGHFVPNLSFGAPVIRSLKTRLPWDIHLMVQNPKDRIQEFLECGAKTITFHAEAVQKKADRSLLIKAIQAGGARAGIAVNPETPITAIEGVLDEVDMVLLMTVHPGFAGQEFCSEVLEKIRALHNAHPSLMIQVDGGINPQTALQCREAGATNLVAASAIFSAKDRSKAIASLRG
jgi:ribulose-phosphate 3-epimerase